MIWDARVLYNRCGQGSGLQGEAGAGVAAAEEVVVVAVAER